MAMSRATEADTYSGFTIEDRGAGPRAVFKVKDPRHYHPDGREVTENIFTEPALRGRIRYLENEGQDASMSRAALAIIVRREIEKEERDAT